MPVQKYIMNWMSSGIASSEVIENIIESEHNCLVNTTTTITISTITKKVCSNENVPRRELNEFGTGATYKMIRA